MKRFIAVFLAMVVFVKDYRAADLDLAEASVVMLTCPHPVTATFNGVEHEVWLRNPKNNESFRQIRIAGGTGFLLRGTNNFFIVTAKHIAAEMGSDTELTVRGPAGMPLRVRLLDLVATNGTNITPQISWINHPQADCAIHPITPQSPGFVKLSHAIWGTLETLVTESNAPPK